MADTSPVEEIGTPATDDDERWKQEADDLRHTGLAAIREAAAKWHDSIAVLLGVFSAVAFVKGPESFTDLNGPIAYIVGGFVLGAALLAGISTCLAALASQGSPRIYRLITGPTLRRHHEDALEAVARQLLYSRILAIIAALLIAISVGATWFTALASNKQERVHVLILTDSGEVVCDQIDGDVTKRAAGHIRTVESVERCGGG